MRQAASAALTAGRFTDPAIKLSGTVADVMSVAMLKILLAGGFSARITDDDLMPSTVEVLAGP